MTSRFLCDCGFTLAFCPCCGRALGNPASTSSTTTTFAHTRAERGGGVAEKRPRAAESRVPSHTETGKSAETLAWLLLLTQVSAPTPLSAFDMFCLHQQFVDSGVAPSPGCPLDEAHRRRHAQQWLLADDGERATYEAAAATAAAAAAAAGRRSNATLDDGGQRAEEANAGRPPLPAATTTTTADTAAAAKKRKKTAPSRHRPPTSFMVFRHSQRGKGSAAEVLRAWKQLTPEEKAPYDREAATQRTRKYLDEAASEATPRGAPFPAAATALPRPMGDASSDPRKEGEEHIGLAESR